LVPNGRVFPVTKVVDASKLITQTSVYSLIGRFIKQRSVHDERFALRNINVKWRPTEIYFYMVRVWLG